MIPNGRTIISAILILTMLSAPAICVCLSAAGDDVYIKGAPEGLTLTHYIVINEMELNPRGKDAGNEWVELFNPTDECISISGWELRTTHGSEESHHIHNTTIVSGGYHVITFGGRFLDNRDESLVLFDEGDDEIDRTLMANDRDNDNKTWQRIPNGHDSGNYSDWEFRPSTVGKSNSKE